jgi:hypothetical protein
MSEPMIKGGVLREFLEWYSIHEGTERVRRLAQQAPDELRAHLDPDVEHVSLLASSWYPSRLVGPLLDALAEGLTEAELRRVAHDSTRWIIQNGTSSAYRFVLRRLVTPEIYALSVDRLWRQFHTTGRREVRLTSRSSAESKVLRWGGHHPLLCTITIETMCAVLETMGCKDVRWDRVECVSQGAKECVTKLEWA